MAASVGAEHRCRPGTPHLAHPVGWESFMQRANCHQIRIVRISHRERIGTRTIDPEEVTRSGLRKRTSIEKRWSRDAMTRSIISLWERPIVTLYECGTQKMVAPSSLDCKLPLGLHDPCP